MNRIIRKLFYAFLTLIIAGIFTSLLLSFVPDHFNKSSVFRRFIANIYTFITFHYGNSMNENLPMTLVLKDRAITSFELIGGAITIIFIFAVPVAIWSAFYRNSARAMVYKNVFYVFSSVPTLIWATLLLAFSAKLFGVYMIRDSMEGASITRKFLIYVMPVLSLSFGDGLISDVYRIIYEETSKFLENDFLKALKSRNVNLRKNIFYGLINPIFSVFSSKISYLISGTIVVEYIFNWRGLGYQILVAISTPGAKDYPFILASTTLFVGIALMFSLASDVIILATDPRLRN